MKYIFVTHSNICSLVIYNSVLKLIKEKQKVIIIKNRGVKWLFEENGIIFFDLSNLHRRWYIYRPKSIIDLIKRYYYIYLLNKDIKRIINKDDFILYIPNYSVNYQAKLAEDKKCKGYYLIEEGLQSYNYDYLKQCYKNRSFLLRHKNLFGLTDRFCMETTEKFLGTIAISKDAFDWNSKQKIVEKEFPKLLTNYSTYKNIVVTGFLGEDMELVRQKLKFLLKSFEERGEREMVVKFHPHVYYNSPQKIVCLENFLRQQKGMSISILPADYIVEFSIIKDKSSIYSLDEFSSLNIYSLMFGGKSYICTQDKLYEFHNIEECLTYVNNLV